MRQPAHVLLNDLPREGPCLAHPAAQADPVQLVVARRRELVDPGAIVHELEWADLNYIAGVQWTGAAHRFPLDEGAVSATQIPQDVALAGCLDPRVEP